MLLTSKKNYKKISFINAHALSLPLSLSPNDTFIGAVGFRIMKLELFTNVTAIVRHKALRELGDFDAYACQKLIMIPQITSRQFISVAFTIKLYIYIHAS